MSSDCHARQQSDEMYCAPCNLRWDVNDPAPPECNPIKTETISADRETLEKVAKGFRELALLQNNQRALTAQMLRACIARLKSPSPGKRQEAIRGLTDLAEMLDKNA